MTTRICRLKTVTGGKAKVQEKEEVMKKAKAFHGVTLGTFSFLSLRLGSAKVSI